MDENANPQVAIVQNNTNNGTINPQCFDNVIFYRESNSSLNTPSNVTNTSGVVSWNAVTGATSYNVKVNQYDNGTVTTSNLTSSTNSIDLTAYGKCEVSVQAVNSIGDTSSYSSICSNRTDVIADFKSTDSASLIASTTTAGLNGSTVTGAKYNNDGTVEIDVRSSGANQNFNISPASELDTTKAGIIIRFKVVTTGYTSSNTRTFTFRFAGPSNGENYAVSDGGYSATQDSVTVNVGEWQTLVLPMSAVILDRSKTIAFPPNGHYEYGNTAREKLYFTLLASEAQAGSAYNVIATILIDEISYCVAPEKPTNVSLDNGMLTWDEVWGATSYNVKVNQYNNGTVTTTDLTSITTNSIDLTAYGECEVSVQTVNSVGTSSWSSICSNRTDVIYDFNSEPSEPIIASTTTANGYTGSTVNSVTYNDDGTVEIEVCSSYQHQNFNIKPTSELDSTHDGITVRFKVVTTGYSNKTFTFQLAGPANTENYTTTNDSIAVSVGEWQTLVLPMSSIILVRDDKGAWTGQGHYEWGNATREKLYFTLRADSGQSGNPVATILIDDISYYDLPTTPTGLSMENGVLTWNNADNATSYNVKVNQYNNGTVTTTDLTSITTNSIDLTAYGECEVSVRAVSSVGTSSWSSIYSNRTNVILDFNSEPSDTLIASTTTASLNGSTVNSVTYNDDGTVQIDVRSSYANQNFNIIPTSALDTTKAGIVIRFKVVDTGYTPSSSETTRTFTFRFAGPTNGENYAIGTYAADKDSVTVNVGEWQTLVLPMSAVILDRTQAITFPPNGHYEWGNANRSKLYFTLLASAGESQAYYNTVATILIDDISYITAN